MSDFSEENAMDLVATMVAEDLAESLGISQTDALARFLASRTAEMLYDPALKLWWDGPAYVANAYRKEVEKDGQASDPVD